MRYWVIIDGNGERREIRGLAWLANSQLFSQAKRIPTAMGLSCQRHGAPWRVGMDLRVKMAAIFQPILIDFISQRSSRCVAQRSWK